MSGKSILATQALDDSPRIKPFTPDTYERALAVCAVVLAGFVFAALLRGRAEWDTVPSIVWLHLATIVTALLLTPVMLLRSRGDPLHRQLGWVWAAAMLLTAIDSLFIRTTGSGRFNIIQILSVWTMVQVPITCGQRAIIMSSATAGPCAAWSRAHC